MGLLTPRDFSFIGLGLGLGTVIVTALQVILMSNQELKTTVLNPVPQVIVFSHLSFKCSHKIFLIFGFQMSYSLHSPTLLSNSGEE